MLCVSDGKQEIRKRGIREGPGFEVCLWKVEGFAVKGVLPPLLLRRLGLF